MVTANWFVTATEARNNIVKDIAVHGEISALEHEIMRAVQRGDYEVTVAGASPFSQLPDNTSEVFTVDVISNQLYVPNHAFKHQDVVTVSSTGTLPAPLQPLTYYYVIYVDDDHIKLAASRAHAQSLTPISINIASGVDQITLENVGSGYVTPPHVTISGGSPDSPATAVSHLAVRGRLESVQVLDPGAGFTYTPSILITAQGAGAEAGVVRMKVVQITGVAFGGGNYNVGDILTLITGGGLPAATARVTQVNGGAVTQVMLISGGSYASDSLPNLSASTTVSSGIGSGCTLDISVGLATIAVANGGLSYAQPPLVTIQGGGGSQAQAQAQLSGGVVTGLIVTNAGSGYTHTPSVTISNGGGATAVAQLAPTKVSRVDLVNNGGAFYVDTPSVQLTVPGTGAQLSEIRMKVMQVDVRSSGTNYVVGDQIYVSGGTGIRNAVLQVMSVNSVGAILQLQIVDGGSYTQLPMLQNNPVYGGTGINAIVDVMMGVDVILLQSGGSNYQVPPLVIITGSATRQAQAQARIQNGSVVRVDVWDPGVGYTQVPQVSFTCGSGATAQAILVPTGVQFVDVTNGGSGYVTPPSVSIQGGGGAGAQAEAIIQDGEVIQINVTDPGSGYTSTPQVIISGNATAQVSLFSTPVDRIELTTEGENYVLAPTVVIDGDAQALAMLTPTEVRDITVTASGSDYSSDPQVQWEIGVEETGTPRLPVVRTQRSFSVSQIVVTNPGDNYQSVPTVSLSAPLATGTQATATASLSVGSGIFLVTLYTESQDYWKVNCGLAPSSNLLVRPYKDQIASVKKYFEDLGYSVVLETNPVTGVTLRWTIRW
jgi:hypothetical protein